MDELKNQIQVVVEARGNAEKVMDIVAASSALWEQENREIIEVRNAFIELRIEAEATLRELTLQAYAETKDKAPAPGVGIREITKLDYDPRQALTWAANHGMALKLDVGAFEKIAKVSPFVFVTISTEPQATIATNLEAK